MSRAVALFVRPGSCYFELAASAFDASRDARRYVGSLPVVAHPPCRAWGRLRHMAKPRHDEKALALFGLMFVFDGRVCTLGRQVRPGVFELLCECGAFLRFVVVPS